MKFCNSSSSPRQELLVLGKNVADLHSHLLELALLDEAILHDMDFYDIMSHLICIRGKLYSLRGSASVDTCGALEMLKVKSEIGGIT